VAHKKVGATGRRKRPPGSKQFMRVTLPRGRVVRRLRPHLATREDLERLAAKQRKRPPARQAPMSRDANADAEDQVKRKNPRVSRRRPTPFDDFATSTNWHGLMLADRDKVAGALDRVVADARAVLLSHAPRFVKIPSDSERLAPLALVALDLIRQGDRKGLATLRRWFQGRSKADDVRPLVDLEGRYRFQWLGQRAGAAARALPTSSLYQRAVLGWYFELRQRFKALHERYQRSPSASAHTLPQQRAWLESWNDGLPEGQRFRSLAAMREGVNGVYDRAARLELGEWFRVRSRAGNAPNAPSGPLNRMLAAARRETLGQVEDWLYPEQQRVLQRLLGERDDARRKRYHKRLAELTDMQRALDTRGEHIELAMQVERFAKADWRRHGPTLQRYLSARD